MFYLRKKRILKNLDNSFGKIKTEGFNFDQIKRYFSQGSKVKQDFSISEQTCHDLDFDLFFCYVDRTNSKVGQQYLYDHLRKNHFSEESFKNREEIVSFLEKNPKIRLEIQYQLNHLSSKQATYIVDLFQHEMEKKSSWFFIIPVLACMCVSSIVLAFFNPHFLFVLLGLFPVNVILHFSLKQKTNLFLNSIPSFLSLLSVAKHLSKIESLAKINREINHTIFRFAGIKRKMSFFKLEQKVDSDIEAAYWFLIEVFKMVFLLEPILLYNSLENLRNSQKDLETIFRFVGEVDLCVSIASLRHEGSTFCIPSLNNMDNKITFENLRHPLIVDCVANTTISEKSMLITGSNMSGKTTFMRAIGLNYISGISLNTCFASSATLPKAKLLSMIRIEDDVTDASSYFFKEMETMRTILSEVQANLFSILLVDELFKGTNTVERIAISKAVLSYLAKKSCQVFVSSHDLELANMLENEFELGYFSEIIEKDELIFDYKLKKGIPPQRNAIRILELHDFPPEIITLSKEIASRN